MNCGLSLTDATEIDSTVLRYYYSHLGEERWESLTWEKGRLRGRVAMKPWETKEWTEMRDRHIGSTCEQCESTDGPFVLQHFSHEQPEPPSKYTIVWDLIGEFGLMPSRPTIPLAACPKCKRRSLTEPKIRKPKWRCIGCHHEFDELATVEVEVDSRNGKDEYNQYIQDRRDVYTDFQITHADAVAQRYGAALADYEKERQASYEEYVSGEGTATFCKKCAFLWDIKEMRLCSQCKTDYHPFKYRTCFNCLPTSRKEELAGYREFATEMDAVMESLEEAYDELPDLDSSSSGSRGI